MLSINDSHFHKAYMPFQQSRFSRNESLQDKGILLRYHSRLQWFTVRKCSGFAIWNDSNAYYVVLAFSPLPVIVTTRIFTFLVDIPLQGMYYFALYLKWSIIM